MVDDKREVLKIDFHIEKICIIKTKILKGVKIKIYVFKKLNECLIATDVSDLCYYKKRKILNIVNDAFLR